MSGRPSLGQIDRCPRCGAWRYARNCRTGLRGCAPARRRHPVPLQESHSHQDDGEEPQE